MTRILMALATLALVSPASAVAKRTVTIAPPGDSAVSQYVEVVPGDTGASPPQAGGGQGGPITSGQRGQLDRLGASGRTLAAVVAATAPEPIAAADGSAWAAASDRRGRTATSGVAGRRGAGPGAGVSPGALTGTDTSRVVSGAGAPSAPALILDAAAGGGASGLGIFLPVIMVACAVGVVAGALRQRRSRS